MKEIKTFDKKTFEFKIGKHIIIYSDNNNEIKNIKNILEKYSKEFIFYNANKQDEFCDIFNRDYKISSNIKVLILEINKFKNFKKFALFEENELENFIENYLKNSLKQYYYSDGKFFKKIKPKRKTH
jgi:hypothetical protein